MDRRRPQGLSLLHECTVFTSSLTETNFLWRILQKYIFDYKMRKWMIVEDEFSPRPALSDLFPYMFTARGPRKTFLSIAGCYRYLFCLCRTSQLDYILQDVTEADISSDLYERINEDMRYEMVRSCKYHGSMQNDMLYYCSILICMVKNNTYFRWQKNKMQKS